MKAQVFRGVNNLSYEDIPIPELAADEVLVQVKVVGPLPTLRTTQNFRT
jgi:L-iditol 2-dehydrogenase